MNLDETVLLEGSSLVPGREADDALLSLLASMACSDGEIHPSEMRFVQKLLPGLTPEQAETFVRQHAGPFALEGLGQVITDPSDRWKTLRFVARMAWKDGELARSERELLQELADELGMTGAVERVLREMSPDDGRRYGSDRLLKMLMDIHWDSVQLASGSLVSADLVAVTPAKTEMVARVGLDKVEVMGVCTDGVVARFQEGAAFLRWSELVTYTRDFGLGSALKLHLEDSRAFTLVDQRLAGFATFLDRVLEGERAKKAPTPLKVERVRGE